MARTRAERFTVRVTEQERDYINSVKAELKLSLTELMLKGVEALQREVLTNSDKEVDKNERD